MVNLVGFEPTLIMKPIEKDELYGHLGGFLKAKGIELKDGSYARAIQKGCGILADVINLSQQGMEKAKQEVTVKVDQMRQVIHEKTAPKPPPASKAEAGASNPKGPGPAKPPKAGPRRAAAKAKKSRAAKA